MLRWIEVGHTAPRYIVKPKGAKDVGQLQQNKMGFLYILRGKNYEWRIYIIINFMGDENERI